MSKYIERKYLPFVISLIVVAILGLIAALVMLRTRSWEPVKIAGRTAYALQFSHDGNTLLGLSTINGHPLLCAWNPQDGRERWRWSFPSEERAPFSLAQSPDGKYIATISVTTENRPPKEILRLWEVDSGHLARTFSWFADRGKVTPKVASKTGKNAKNQDDANRSSAHRGSSLVAFYEPRSLHYRHDGKLLIASSGEDASSGDDEGKANTIIKVLDSATGKASAPEAILPGSWTILELAETGSAILASNGTNIAIWEPSSVSPRWQTPGTTAASDKELRFISIKRTGKLAGIERNSGRMLWEVPDGGTSQLELHGEHLIAATETGTVEVRRANDGGVQQTFEVTLDYKGASRLHNVDAIAVSPDGSLLAAGGHRYEQDHILIWRLR